MKKILFACVLMSGSLSAFAIPNYWSATYAQGYMEYGISNDKHLSVIIACNVAADDEADNGVYVYHGEALIDTHDIAFIIDDEAYYIPEETKTRSEGNMWDSFTRAIMKADQFEVYVDDKPIGKFQPNEKNRLKIFTNFQCDPLHYRGISH
ncbi:MULTISPECIES: hypothetical protein [Providencia]|nr:MULTISPECIES: hypothetical protein [Providencia]MCR4079268.1 hypothetical protein [Providencia stuartii]MDN7223471.1 hypothetical protein [Providencia stuartii]WAZ78070.1 hypothetical protein O4001_17935 [Providencia stuartii]